MFYYSPNRPILQGFLLPNMKPLSVQNFPEKVFCPEIDDFAYGKAEFDAPLSGCEAMLCDLVPQGSKHYYGVKYVRDGRHGRLHINQKGDPKIRLMSAHGIRMPSKREETRVKPSRITIYDHWFATQQEREMFIDELGKEVEAYEVHH